MANRYVDPDASGAGTGLDWTNAYTSLAAWQAAEVTDLVTAAESHVCHCRSSSGTADTTSVAIAGWTTSTTYTLTIEAALADSHGGVQDTGYVLHRNVVWADGIDVQDDNVTLRNLAVKGCRDGVISRNPNIVIDGCFIYDAADYGIRLRTTTTGAVIKNCMIVNCDDAIGCVDFSQSVVVSYCTIVACTNGLSSTNSTLVANNCYVQASGTCYAGFTLTTCASSDDTGTAGLRSVAYSVSSGAYFTNVTAGSEDLKITSSSALYQTGTVIAGITTDMFGNTRDTSSPCIGLHELVTGSTINRHRRKRNRTIASFRRRVY